VTARQGHPYGLAQAVHAVGRIHPAARAARRAGVVLEQPDLVVHLEFEETSGMVIIAAAPIQNEKGELLGILYGGRLLNHLYNIVDEISNTIFEHEQYKKKEVGVVTIFMNNIRISTNMKTEEGQKNAI